MRKAILAATSFLFVIGTIGSNIGPALVDNHPLLVISLSARNRNLFGSVPYIDALPFFVVGFVRLLCAAVALFLVGRWYGDRTLAWVERKADGLPAIYHWAERAVDRLGWLAVLLMPGSNIVCALVGHRRMEPRRFVGVATVGIALRLIVLWAGGKAFEDQIRWFLSHIERYQWWIVIGLFALSFLQSLRQNATTRSADTLEVLSHDLPTHTEPDPNL